jgi:tetratricopeptide (TPR) repeat protein
VWLSRYQWLDMSDWMEREAADPGRFEIWYAGKLKEILDLLADSARREYAGEIAALETRLAPVGQEAEIGARLKGLVGRQWLAEAVESWRRGQAAERILLLTAPPGAGKSAFAAQLAHRRPDVVAAIHFCRWNVEERCDPARVFRTLAFQLASRLPDYRRLLGDRLANAEPDSLAPKGPAALFDWLLVEPLRFAIDGGRRADRLLVVVDGLDETLRDGRSALAEMLAQGAAKLPPWIALMVTSRPEPAVLRQFAQARALAIEPGSVQNEGDLRAYLKQWTDGSPALAAPGPEAIDRILAASGGSFLYLSMLRQAGTGLNLDPVAPEALPRGLVGLYELWFRRQFPHPEDYDKALPLLELVVAAREPVPDLWIDRLLSWPKRERARVLESLGSLIARGVDGLAPFHKSLFDWLVDENAAGADYVVDVEAGARRLLAGLWEAFTAWADGDRTAPLDSFCIHEIPRLAGDASDSALRSLAAGPWPALWEAIGTVIGGLPRERERESILAWRRLSARVAGFGDTLAERSEALRAVGDLLRTLGRRDEAYRAYDEALAIARDLRARPDAGPAAKRALLSSLIRRGNRLVAEGAGRERSGPTRRRSRWRAISPPSSRATAPTGATSPSPSSASATPDSQKPKRPKRLKPIGKAA